MPSGEPSSTTTTSMASGRRRGSPRRRPRSRPPRDRPARSRRCARAHARTAALEPERAEHLARPVRVGVLVEHALVARARPSPSPRPDRRAAGGRRRAPRRASSTTSSSLPGSNHCSMPVVRVRDDRGAGRGELERTTRRRARHRRVRPARHVEVDPRRRDRARERVERDVAEQPRAADVALEVAAAEREVDARVASARLAHHRRRPLPPELVAVAVEEDVRTPSRPRAA